MAAGFASTRMSWTSAQEIRATRTSRRTVIQSRLVIVALRRAQTSTRVTAAAVARSVRPFTGALSPVSVAVWTTTETIPAANRTQTHLNRDADIRYSPNRGAPVIVPPARQLPGPRPHAGPEIRPGEDHLRRRVACAPSARRRSGRW